MSPRNRVGIAAGLAFLVILSMDAFGASGAVMAASASAGLQHDIFDVLSRALRTWGAGVAAVVFTAIAGVFGYVRQSVHVVRAKRRQFFKSIVWALEKAPTEIDQAMGQAQFWISPNKEGRIIDSKMGTLVLHVRPEFNGKSYHFWYSIYQIGDVLKIGILLERGLESAPILEGNNEIEKIWVGPTPEVHDRDGQTMYQWTFPVADLYSSWQKQESFVLGMRHCHFRMLRIIHDGCKVSDGGADLNYGQGAEIHTFNVGSVAEQIPKTRAA